MKNKNAITSEPVGASPLNAQTICYVTGRSGGHLLPALTHAREHRAQRPEDHILFITTDTQLDHDIMRDAAGVDETLYVPLPNVPRSLFMYPWFIVRCLLTFLQSIRYMRKNAVAHVVSFGGYISVPVCLAARCLRIPITLVELNTEPGKAMQFLAPYAQHIYVCFKQAASHFKQPTTCIPYPLRYTKIPTREEITQHMHKHLLLRDKMTVLILGGSQGSMFLNRAIGNWFDAMPDICEQIQIVHQVGAHDTTNWHRWYRDRGVSAIIFRYCDDLSLWYATADLIICRAGAGTLFEVLFFNKRCVVIPLVTASTSHQVDNARAMVEEHPELFTVVEQSIIEHDPMQLFNTLRALLWCDN